MPHNCPLRPRSTVTRNDRAGFDLLADALEKPFGTFVALEVFETVALIAKGLVEVGSPFRYADVACLWVVIDVVGEGEGRGVRGRAGD